MDANRLENELVDDQDEHLDAHSPDDQSKEDEPSESEQDEEMAIDGHVETAQVDEEVAEDEPTLTGSNEFASANNTAIGMYSIHSIYYIVLCLSKFLI